MASKEVHHLGDVVLKITQKLRIIAELEHVEWSSTHMRRTEHMFLTKQQKVVPYFYLTVAISS